MQLTGIRRGIVKTKVYWHAMCSWLAYVLRCPVAEAFHETAELIYLAQLCFGVKR